MVFLLFDFIERDILETKNEELTELRALILSKISINGHHNQDNIDLGELRRDIQSMISSLRLHLSQFAHLKIQHSFEEKEENVEGFLTFYSYNSVYYCYYYYY